MFARYILLLAVFMFAVAESAASAEADCINDCEAELRFCLSLVSDSVGPCKNSCDAECNFIQNLAGCREACIAQCESNYTNGLTQCNREYQYCSEKCRSRPETR